MPGARATNHEGGFPMRAMPASVAPVPFEVEAADGEVLGATMFPPSGRGLGTVLVHGATAVPQSYYRHFAAFLATRGMRVITYDYRGVGASRPASLRGFSATM